MRLSILFLLLASTAYGQALSVTCTKATQGSTATCTGSGGTGPYTYSVSAGSGSIGSSSGTYTPPTTVEVKQKVGPCQLLPPDHIYNTRIDALPAHADSDTIVGRTSSTQIQFEASLALNIMDNSTPTFGAVFYYTGSNNGTFMLPGWPLLKMQSGMFTMPFGPGNLGGGEDRHILGVNRETCEFSELYNQYDAGVKTDCPTCTSQSGVKYSTGFGLPTTGATDAAGMAIQPVTLRLSDIQSGVVQHALRFTMANSRIQTGASTNFQWPALTGNSAPSSSNPSWKYGMYARLKSSVDISSYSATAQIILTGLKHYGMIMTDGGTNWAVTVAPDLALDKSARAALREIFGSALRSTDFEAVDTSAMDLTASSGAVNLANGDVTPSQYAEVTVTDAAMATATARVNLEGITVGTPESTMTIMAGHTVTPTWWVTGTATQTVTWTMDPDVGTLNSSTGQFTPDAGVTTPTRTRLTATSTVEATATAVIDVIVWPDNASGNIYQDWGHGDTTTKTYDGKSFFADEFVQVEGWPGVVDQNTAGGDIYTNVRYFTTGDTHAKYYLPNGNYKARVYVKTNISSGSISPSEYQIHYESQGKMIYRNYSIGRATGGVHGVGGYVDLPMDVTDGSGKLSFRHLTIEGAKPYIAAIAIEADATTPYLTIDSGDALGDITMSQTRQFYAVGWYMSDSVSWSVQSGPGSIDVNGLYTAPSTPPATDTAVTVRATSTVDGGVYAETTFDFAFGTVTVTGPASVGRGKTAQFAASIGGVSYTNVTWSRSGAQGSINSSGLYTAPSSVADATITITATPVDAGGSAGTADLDLVQLIDPIRLRAAVASHTEGGRVWEGWPGTKCSVSGSPSGPVNVDSTIANVPIAGQEPLYEGRRYINGAGTFGLDCSVPNGVFSVTMKWANVNASNDKAKFDLQLEGVTVVSGFDITVEAGAVQAAVDRTYTTVVTDGVLTLRLVGVSNDPSQSVWAQFNAAEVLDLGPIPDNAKASGAVVTTGGVIFK